MLSKGIRWRATLRSRNGRSSTEQARAAAIQNVQSQVEARHRYGWPGLPADASYGIYTVFFGLDLLCLAYLVLRSRFLPRAIGVLLVIDGLAHLIYSFTQVLAPGVAAGLVPWIQLPAPVAEGALSLWLLVRGVSTRRWTTRAGPALRAPSPSAQAPT